MLKDYYPSAYEVYITTFFAPINGDRGFQSDRVVKSPMNEVDAEDLVQELRGKIANNEYVSKRKID